MTVAKAVPYEWHDSTTGQRTPGIRIGTRRAFVWVPYAEAIALADDLVDLTEQHAVGQGDR